MVHSDMLQFIIGQMLEPVPLPSEDLTGQTIALGPWRYEMNVSHLILACRSPEKGETARQEILASSRLSSPGKVYVWQLDMAEHSSVLAFGKRINNLTRLDSFIANAGIDAAQFVRAEGHESTLTVNVISTLLVAMLVISRLRESSKELGKPSHLVFTGSVVHVNAKHSHLCKPKQGQMFKNLDDENMADMANRYPLSKLVLLLGFRKLAEEISRSEPEPGQTSVISNFVHPGYCKTDLFKSNDGGIGGRLLLLLSVDLLKRVVEHWCMELWLTKQPTGNIWPNIQERLWPELVDILDGIQPGVTKLE
ncbi:Short chain dehydrogenase [Lachnellula occidentalis]|uniref:Short chain dehydrogenase n=1 Tax=Lachnellula occidentalis TaxID=215460 RepID=A0A8H8RS11_9HELO|nr:Short chain dehydrogenase [Lachnellula occidentalis]